MVCFGLGEIPEKLHLVHFVYVLKKEILFVDKWVIALLELVHSLNELILGE